MLYTMLCYYKWRYTVTDRWLVGQLQFTHCNVGNLAIYRHCFNDEWTTFTFFVLLRPVLPHWLQHTHTHSFNSHPSTWTWLATLPLHTWWDAVKDNTTTKGCQWKKRSGGEVHSMVQSFCSWMITNAKHIHWDLSPVSTTRVHGRSSRTKLTAHELGCIFDTRVDGRQLRCIFWHPSTRAVNSGSGNRALSTIQVVVVYKFSFS